MTQRSTPASSWQSQKLTGLKTWPSKRGWARRSIRPDSGTLWAARTSRTQAAPCPDFSAIPGQCADEALAEEIEQEYRRQLFRTVAAEVRPQVQPTTWQAFWRTAVEGESSVEVARQLELSIGAVYAARSRVMARIKALVQRRMASDESR